MDHWPFSSISMVVFWILIVLAWSTGGKFFSPDRSSEWNKELTKVDLPKPLSPTTINVNSKPLFTDFRWTFKKDILYKNIVINDPLGQAHTPPDVLFYEIFKLNGRTTCVKIVITTVGRVDR